MVHRFKRLHFPFAFGTRRRFSQCAFCDTAARERLRYLAIITTLIFASANSRKRRTSSSVHGRRRFLPVICFDGCIVGPPAIRTIQSRVFAPPSPSAPRREPHRMNPALLLTCHENPVRGQTRTWFGFDEKSKFKSSALRERQLKANSRLHFGKADSGKFGNSTGKKWHKLHMNKRGRTPPGDWRGFHFTIL